MKKITTEKEQAARNQREVYWSKYFVRKDLLHQEQVANLYYDNAPVVDTVSHS